ncbi:MAG: tetratricopeptide repeat protein, partial [Bacteroidota bacterium]
AQPPTSMGQRAAAEGQFVRALTALRLGDNAEAARLLDEILRARPTDAAVLDARAEAALALADASSALFYAQQAAEQAPDEPSVHLRLAEAFRQTGDAASAVGALDTARRLDATDPAPLVALADLHAAAGDTEAERETLEALVRLGDTPAARLRLSVLYERAGDTERALDAARRAVRLAPGEPRLRDRVASLRSPDVPAAPGPDASDVDGEALHAAGRYAEAADALLDLVEREPRRLDAWALALDALARTGDPRAGATADDALLLFPSVPSVLAPAAEAYLAAGRSADARDAAERGLQALDILGDVDGADAFRARLQRALADAG